MFNFHSLSPFWVIQRSSLPHHLHHYYINKVLVYFFFFIYHSRIMYKIYFCLWLFPLSTWFIFIISLYDYVYGYLIVFSHIIQILCAVFHVFPLYHHIVSSKILTHFYLVFHFLFYLILGPSYFLLYICLNPFAFSAHCVIFINLLTLPYRNNAPPPHLSFPLSLPFPKSFHSLFSKPQIKSMHGLTLSFYLPLQLSSLSIRFFSF